MIIRQSRGGWNILTLICLALFLGVELTLLTKTLSFLSTMTLVCLMTVLGSLNNEIKIPEKEELKDGCVYTTKKAVSEYLPNASGPIHWNCNNGAKESGSILCHIKEVWPNESQLFDSRIYAFADDPAETFLVKKERINMKEVTNLIPLSLEELNELRGSHNTAKEFLNKLLQKNS